jgi:EmrB/QacA subfamily drug resistance transporter
VNDSVNRTVNDSQPRRFAAVFTVVAAGIAMVNLDLFIVNVAIPSIGRAFGGAELSSLSWVLNAYAIVFAALLVPAGRAADRIGRRKAFLVGVVVFAVASAACAFADNVWLLVVARIVQAVGGALLMPASLGLLLAATPPNKRTGAIRGWTSVGGVAAALGPVIGGALVEVSWRWVFLVNVPVAALTLIASPRVLPKLAAVQDDSERPDMAGAAVLTAAIGTLALALVKADGWGWSSWRVSGLIGLSVVLLGYFWWRSARHSSPVIEPHMFRLPAFGTATLANLVFGTAFGAMLLLVTLWCQDVWHWSALHTGLAIAPGPLLVPFLAIGAGPLARRVGPGPVAFLGCLSYVAGCLFWRFSLSLTPDYVGSMLPGMLLTGVGVGLTLPTLVSAGVSAVPPHRFATGSGVVTMARQVGVVLGVAILVTVLGSPATPLGSLRAFQHATVFTAVAAGLAGLSSLLLIRARRHTGGSSAGSTERSSAEESSPVGSAAAAEHSGEVAASLE